MSPQASGESVFGRTTLIQGSELLLVERAVSSVLKRADEQCPGLQKTELEAGDTSPADFIEATGGSLFAEQSLVVVEHCELLPPETVDALINFAQNPSAEVAVITTHPGGNKGRGTVDKLKKAGAARIEVKAPKTWELPRFVQGEARAQRVQMSADAAQMLVDAVGTDLRALAGAVDQLISDRSEERIGIDMVGRYFSGRAEVSSFAISDEVLAGHPGSALEKLRWAQGQGVAAVLVTSALANAFRSLGRYSDVRSTRMSDAEMSRTVGVPPWKIKSLARQSRMWDERAIAQGIIAIADADGAVKGAATDPQYALENLVLKLDRIRRGN